MPNPWREKELYGTCALPISEDCLHSFVYSQCDVYSNSLEVQWTILMEGKGEDE